ncbi:hypothetical protein K469DRAFT_707965 [Zopfia rhizophila CBS 207.26]|uniref:Ribosomal protein/NADH dehydrogenase domain-containing protein n=1 Tax=Zopfia rhizophila CBS 207.26 TaxID=1314779 RepID=A0A6A6E1U6_9PEZI|nr:hypothetical protein K469DRAFT_707965 [Zopfia rhizophila CBS 207.26]
MVNIIKRMRKLRELLWIRVGPGALILPKEVSKISMEFNTKINGGHRGARKFWREMLPRIKYRNPAIPIQISRHNDANGPAKLYIYTSPSSPSSTTDQNSTTTTNSTATQTPETAKPTHTIDLRMVPESQILAELIKATKAEVIEAGEAELSEMRDIEEQKMRSAKDREEVREKLVKERREAELLRLARGEAGLA